LEITYNIKGFFQPLRLVGKVRPVSLAAHAQVQGFFGGVKSPMIPGSVGLKKWPEIAQVTYFENSQNSLIIGWTGCPGWDRTGRLYSFAMIYARKSAISTGLFDEFYARLRPFPFSPLPQ